MFTSFQAHIVRSRIITMRCYAAHPCQVAAVLCGPQSPDCGCRRSKDMGPPMEKSESALSIMGHPLVKMVRRRSTAWKRLGHGVVDGVRCASAHLCGKRPDTVKEWCDKEREEITLHRKVN
ncbi:hypothetical protein Y032_0009g567 [Ancylostoma ceylanicum]|uniref:Uncharacterized protein n=1 Tax=Ancylostoma ceylanicum TaxID=53326 RepID=A0A016VJI3_9BILA|nr:hypothetical protein Y032_0009g567 [Ancylostoma ceylanicum]